MTTKRPALLNILILLLGFIGIGAVISGAMLFISPQGDLMKMPVDMLEGSPFSSYLIPGIILFLFIGVFSLLTVYGLLKQPGWKWPDWINPARNIHWAWSASWAAGVIMLLWIAVETILLGYVSFLQPLIAVWGLIIIVLTMIPIIKNFFTRIQVEI
jgi:hypothetical protein